MRRTTPASFKRQNGLTYLTFLLILSVAIFIGLFAIKIVPIYFENMTVAKIVDDLNENDEVLKKSRPQVMLHISQAYRMNSLWSMKAADSIVLTRENGRYHAAIKYEKRANLFGNIDLVTSFDTTGKSAEEMAEADGS